MHKNKNKNPLSSIRIPVHKPGGPMESKKRKEERKRLKGTALRKKLGGDW